MKRPEPSLFPTPDLRGAIGASYPHQARQAASLDACFRQIVAMKAEIAALRVSTAKLRAQAPAPKPPPELEP